MANSQVSVLNFPFLNREPAAQATSELDELKAALQERDTLIRQLVGELVQVNQNNRQLQFASPEHSDAVQRAQQDQLEAMAAQNLYLETTVRELDAKLAATAAGARAREAELAAQIHHLEQQLQLTRQDLDSREAGLRTLLGKIQELSEENRQMERHLQEVPELYRRKFTERLNPITEKIRGIQHENQRLQLEMQGMTRRLLAVREAVSCPMLPAAGDATTPEEASPDRPLLAENL